MSDVPSAPAPTGATQPSPAAGPGATQPSPAPSAPPTMAPPRVPGAAPKRNGMNGQFSKPAGSAPPDPADERQEGEAKPPEPPRKLKSKLKIDGEEREEEATEEELWADRRLRKASEKRFEEAARMRREAETERAKVKELEEEYGKSPVKAMLKKGFSPQQILDQMESDVRELLAKEQMSPEQRELESLRTEKLERERAAKTEEQKRHQAAEDERFHAEIEEDSAVITKALELSKLPKSDLTLELMAKAHRSNKTNGVGLSEAELAKATRAQLGEHLDASLEGMSDDDVLDLYPKTARRIADALKARYSKRMAAKRDQPAAAPEPERPVRAKRGLTDLEMDYLYGLRRPPPGWKPPT